MAADAESEPCEEKQTNQTTTKDDDSDLALKHQWKVLRRLPTVTHTHTHTNYADADDCVEEDVAAVPALSVGVDLKLYWEERRRVEIPVRPPSLLRRFFPQYGRRWNEEQVRPGAFFIPGPHNRVDDDIVGDEDEPAVALAMEVSEDRERQLELYLEEIRRQNEALIRTLQNIDAAHAIPEHLRQSNVRTKPSHPLTKCEKLLLSGCVFVAVLGLGIILLLTILIVTHHAPGFVMRENIIKVFGVIVKYNVTEKTKTNWITPPSPLPSPDTLNLIRSPVSKLPTASPVASPETLPESSLSSMPTYPPTHRPTNSPTQTPSAKTTTANFPTSNPTQAAPSAVPIIASSAPSLIPTQSLGFTTNPTMRPTIRPTTGISNSPSTLLSPQAATTSVTTMPLVGPAFATATVAASSPEPSALPTDFNVESQCRDEFLNYQFCLAVSSDEAAADSCDECLSSILEEAKQQISCTWFQQDFCSAYQNCQTACQSCDTQVQAYVDCLAPSDCSVDCLEFGVPSAVPSARPSSLTPQPTLQPTFATTMSPTESPVPEFTDIEELAAAIDQYVRDSTGWQPMNTWNVSRVTDMSRLFSSGRNSAVQNFNEDISAWDVSRVIDMRWMFSESSFNQEIAAWDVSSVTDMSWMFSYSSFDQALAAWDVSSVTDMSLMFSYSSFNQDLAAWDVSSVTDMSFMLAYSSFNQALAAWDVSSVTDMSGMFFNSSFNQDLAAWDVSSVNYMVGMFVSSSFNQDIAAWDVSSVTDMSWMFYGTSFNQDIAVWDVSGVSDMSWMFSESSFNQNLCRWGSLLNDTIFPNYTTPEETNPFDGTSCPTAASPDMGTSPPGPFCYPCV